MSNSNTAVDWRVTNTPIVFDLANATVGTLVLENIMTSNVTAIVVEANQTILDGSSGRMTTESWIQGQVAVNGGSLENNRGPLSLPSRPSGLTSGSDNMFFGQSYPQCRFCLLCLIKEWPRVLMFCLHADASIQQSNVISVKNQGAKGDGQTDDTMALQSTLDSSANSDNVIYFPNGMYMLSDTLTIPVGARLVGELKTE